MLLHGLILFLTTAATAQPAISDAEPRSGMVSQQTAEDSLTSAFPSPGEERSNVPLTMRGKTWYAHIPPEHEGGIELRFVRPPGTLTLLHSGKSIPFEAAGNGTVSFAVPREKRTGADTVVAATWHLERWEKDIQAMEENAPEAPKNPILFVGSSSIRGWNVARYFPGLPVLNHGFGGSEYFDALCYADRIIAPFSPRAVVLYDGDNDIANGKSPEWVLADMKALVRMIRHAQPETPIIVLSIKTSLSRWNKHAEMEKANELMAGFAAQTPGITYLDVNAPLLDQEGKPDDQYFREDRLHLNHEGYTVWTRLLRPLLDEVLKDPPSN